MELSVNVTGDAQLIALFNRVASADITRAMDSAGAVLLNRIRIRFLKQVNTEGQPWKPSYGSILRKQTGQDGGTLFDTGALFHSIQLSAPAPNERMISTDIPYAKKHQEGLGEEKREFLGISKEDSQVITAVLQKFISGTLIT